MFTVYHKSSTVAVKSFQTASAAKRSCTCMNRNAGSNVYAIATSDFYNTFVVEKKVVKNLMTGQDVVIDSNTPRCCDPSSELYWTM